MLDRASCCVKVSVSIGSITWSVHELGTKNLDFRGFDSIIFLISRGGIPRSIGDFPEI